MTTQDFIKKRFYLETKATKCSSVISDEKGNIYSYGYHYPLLFTINGVAIRNTTGYSSSTGKHIAWSRCIDAIDANCGVGFRLYSDDALNLETIIKAQRNAMQLQYDKISKIRPNTKKYRFEIKKLEDLISNLLQLKQLQVSMS